MKKTLAVVVLTLMLISLVGADAVAQAQDSQRQQMRRTGMQTVRISGRITNMRTVDIGRTERTHQIIELRTNEGETLLADLGPMNRQLRNLRLRKGDQIQVAGKAGRVRGRAVVRAESLQTGERTINLTAAQSVRVQGRIRAVQDLRVDRTGETHRVVLLDTQKGKLAVDLGPRAQMKGLSVREEQRITVEGHLVKAQDKPFMIANRFRVDSGQRQDVYGTPQQRSREMRQNDKGRAYRY